MEKKIAYGPIAVGVVAVLATIIALPNSWKVGFPSFLAPEAHLGLDLAGGTQLDFRISEEEIIKRKADLEVEIASMGDASEDVLAAKRFELQSLENQHQNIVEAIRVVLERRVNALGVSEATITPSYYGTEKHLLVDCPGVIDVQRCIETVGKTIQLEFKEEFIDATDEYKENVRKKANDAFAKIQSGEKTLQSTGQDMISDLGVVYVDQQPYFLSDLPEGLKQFWTRKVGDPPLLTEGTFQSIRTNEEGQQELVDVGGLYIAQTVAAPVVAKRTLQNPTDAMAELKSRSPDSILESQTNVLLSTLDPALQEHLKTQAIGTSLSVNTPTAGVLYLQGRIDGTKRADVSHILVSYKGAERAEATVTRTKEEAEERAKDLKAQLDAGSDFAELARTQSDGPSKVQAGKLEPFGPGAMTPAFEAVAFQMKKGEISSIVETPFGFHIIKADADTTDTGTRVTYSYLKPAGMNAKQTADDYLKQITDGTVTKDEEQITLQVLFFSLEPTGWKDTELNGQYFRSAAVTVDPVTNIPVVQIQFDSKGAELFRELTKNNINKRIAIFVGGELVSAPMVQQEISGGSAVITGSANFDEANRLALDLNTGAIPAPIFLTGQNTIQPTLGKDALNASLLGGFIGFMILCFVLIAIYRLLGVISALTLLFYFILLIASLKLPLLLVTKSYVVITLAGIAGIILSIGMAVDANILIFERMKEEMRKGKTLKTSASTGFKRAWPSIRDGNASTLISSAILIIIGTSIVRGFAITLAIGIFIALFCALVVTKWLLEKVFESPLADHEEYFLRKGSHHTQE